MAPPKRSASRCCQEKVNEASNPARQTRVSWTIIEFDSNVLITTLKDPQKCQFWDLQVSVHRIINSPLQFQNVLFSQVNRTANRLADCLAQLCFGNKLASNWLAVLPPHGELVYLMPRGLCKANMSAIYKKKNKGHNQGNLITLPHI